MKITKFIALASAVLLLFACEQEEVFMNDALEKSAISTKSASSSNNSFLVISNTNKLPKNLVKDLTDANGTLTSAISQVGIAIVESNDPDFKAKASKIKGVQSVVPNLTVQWLDPNEKNVSLEADFGNPPTSGDDDFYFDLQWGHDAIDAPEAWDAGYRGAGVRVAVLDGGFDLDHPDLAPNILTLSKDFTGEGLQYTLGDTFSHGTHTAGTIGAADNGFGTIGVAPEAKLMLLKVLSDEGSGNFGVLIEAIIYAADNEADVISMSLSGSWLKRWGSEYAHLTNAVNRATTYAYQKGSTVIAAAGNDGWDRDHFFGDLVISPADGPNVISISATTPIGWALDSSTNLDIPASYTNFGQSAIDFAAPGGDGLYPGNEFCTVGNAYAPCYVFDLVFSTGNGGWYWSAGTSMATPHAAGVAALIIGKNGGSMKPAQVEAVLRKSADDLGKPGNDDYYGAGRVNAYRAVMN